MCGIAGFFCWPNAAAKTRDALFVMRKRGRDGCGLLVNDKLVFASRVEDLGLGSGAYAVNALGHCLHSVVGHVRQPLRHRFALVANCEIYNWRELCERHGVEAGNDAELALLLFERLGFLKALGEFDGVFAFAFWRGSRVFLGRDLLGVKPLWYSLENGLCFASERKALESLGCNRVTELDPRHVLVFDLKRGKAEFFKRSFFSVPKRFNVSLDEACLKLLELLGEAVEKRVPQRRFGLLFSGGIDSLLLALLFKRMGLRFKCFFAFVRGLGEPKDLAFVRKASELLELDLETVSIGLSDLPRLIRRAVKLIESSDPVRVSVALPLLLACREAKRHGLKVVFSGLGADELFCGYARFRESNNVVLDSINLLLQMHENDLYRDDVIAMDNSLELRLPFLDHKLVAFALGIREEFKLFGQRNKVVLREAALKLGLPKGLVERGKVAAQYGSNFDKAVGRLAKQAKAKGKADYLTGFAEKKNMKLAALFSGGKDSCLALWVMQRQNYAVECLVSILPKSRESFLFHWPQRRVLRLQAKALGIPLLVEESCGVKRAELNDLRRALKRAKEMFGVQGVVSGALYSNYQRERIQSVCSQLQLRLFSPLWHKRQYEEMVELLRSGFVFVVSRVSALGLGEQWLGKRVTWEKLSKLFELGERLGFNVAGEGGEFETIVLDAPNFAKRVRLVQTVKRMESGLSGWLEVKEAVLEDKG